MEQVLEVRLIDSILMNLEKRIEGWNKSITKIIGIPWRFLIGAKANYSARAYLFG
ncbi:hypothetical protein RGQ29_011967 [Quercus rubra]|uniref:Uncharacterized protein n=1 Tax=Quercus rubra TaxID=3512 RepID=A0AAN7J9P2_QUERU|nr:hypothetical protein RGQ29_011967 [Quercus rubra]